MNTRPSPPPSQKRPFHNAALTTLLCLGTMLGCAPKPYDIVVQPGQLLRIPVPPEGPVLLATPPVLPPNWRGDEAYKRLHQLFTALDEHGWNVVAPWEYTPHRRAQGKEILQASDANRVLAALGFRPSQVWLLDIRITESTSAQETDSHRRDSRQQAFRHRRYLQIDLRIVDPRLDKVLLAAAVEVVQNPFAAQDAAVDPMPNLTQAMSALAEDLTKAISKQAQVEFGPGPIAPYLVRHNPQRLEGRLALHQPSLGQELANATETEQLALLLAHYHFFWPDADIDTLVLLRSLPIGLFVTAAAQLPCDCRNDDFLLRDNGVALDGAHTLNRMLRLAEKGPRRLTLIRAGETIDLPLSPPSTSAD